MKINTGFNIKDASLFYALGDHIGVVDLVTWFL